MLPVSAQALYATAADMQKVRNVVERGSAQLKPTDQVTHDDKGIIAPILIAMNDELIKFDCGASLATIGKVIECMNKNVLTYAMLIGFVDELDGRIRDELKTAYAFTLTAQEAVLYDPAEPLISPDFPTKFESATYDVEECAKCLALGRSTAAVFHAMRVMEKGLAAIAACLGIPDPVKPAERNWGVMIGRVEEAVKAKWPKAEDRETGDGHLFESLVAILSTIRNPWRNKSMHPAQKYTEQEAGRIINAVGNFMQQLAERCDEKGEPKA